MFSQVVVGLVLVLSMGLCQQLMVTRRRDGDRVSLSLSGGSSCIIDSCSPNFSYLVEEMQCIEDTTLQTSLGCPGGSISLLAFIAAGSNRLMFDSGGFQAPGENCTVTQVQVVRGVNRINQTIFSINDNGDIIMVSLGTYMREDLIGEIYRLIFTCSNGTPSGCVVFKLNGTTIFSEGKLNGQIEGVSTVPFNCPTTASIPLTSSVATTTDEPSLLEDPTFQTILIAFSGGIGVVLLLITIMCVVICHCHTKNTSTLRVRTMHTELQATKEDAVSHQETYLEKIEMT